MRRVLAVVLLVVPVAFMVWMGWRHRWTSDDGFINFRIVRHVVDGHGPVFNTGQRVEVGTSPLWLAILSVLDLLLPFRLEWIAAITSLAATGGAVALAVFGTRRAFWPAVPKGAVLLPLGAIVYAALPPAWDFATSGLENGLGLLWIAVCWWLLCTRIATGRTEPAPRWWVPVVLSLGPLVRPDLALFSVAFIVALLVLCERRFVTIGRVTALAALVPVVSELARMAYYGDIVPNTAIAKEGMSANWAQGWAYLRDYVTPYALVIPIVLLIVWWLVTTLPSGGIAARPDLVVGLVVVAGGLLHALYIVRVGGDFMHARMLLPTTFMVLLPVSVVAVRARGWWLAGIVLVWAVVCAGWMRPPYSTALPTGFSAAAAPDPYDPGTGIADERLFWVRSSGTAHPVTVDDYIPRNMFAREGAHVARLAADGHRGLLLHPGDNARSLVPLRGGGCADRCDRTGARAPRGTRRETASTSSTTTVWPARSRRTSDSTHEDVQGTRRSSPMPGSSPSTPTRVTAYPTASTRARSPRPATRCGANPCGAWRTIRHAASTSPTRYTTSRTRSQHRRTASRQTR